jgi:hypothetical protein
MCEFYLNIVAKNPAQNPAETQPRTEMRWSVGDTATRKWTTRAHVSVGQRIRTNLTNLWSKMR